MGDVADSKTVSERTTDRPRRHMPDGYRQGHDSETEYRKTVFWFIASTIVLLLGLLLAFVELTFT